MKFGGVILCQKFYQEIIRHLMTSYFILGSVRVEKSRKSEILRFLSCLKFGIGGNFEMLITKKKT